MIRFVRWHWLPTRYGRARRGRIVWEKWCWLCFAIRYRPEDKDEAEEQWLAEEIERRSREWHEDLKHRELYEGDDR